MYYIYIYIYICIYNIKSQNITKLDFKDVLSFHYKGYIYTYTIHMKKLLLTTLIISKVFVHILVNIFS